MLFPAACSCTGLGYCVLHLPPCCVLFSVFILSGCCSVLRRAPLAVPFVLVLAVALAPRKIGTAPLFFCLCVCLWLGCAPRLPSARWPGWSLRWLAWCRSLRPLDKANTPPPLPPRWRTACPVRAAAHLVWPPSCCAGVPTSRQRGTVVWTTWSGTRVGVGVLRGVQTPLGAPSQTA